MAEGGFHGKAPWQAATGDGRRYGPEARQVRLEPTKIKTSFFSNQKT
ncbi:hypothetical protein AWT69_000192 [Pseudomonas putida]|nr:hypothetical protein AWT69_000192 [Pseudomonas putida]